MRAQFVCSYRGETEFRLHGCAESGLLVAYRSFAGLDDGWAAGVLVSEVLPMVGCVRYRACARVHELPSAEVVEAIKGNDRAIVAPVPAAFKPWRVDADGFHHSAGIVYGGPVPVLAFDPNTRNVWALAELEALAERYEWFRPLVARVVPFDPAAHLSARDLQGVA